MNNKSIKHTGAIMVVIVW